MRISSKALSHYLVIAVLFLATHVSMSQVAIGTGSTTPTTNPKAVLLLVGNGTNQGLIIPIVGNRTAIAPSNGEKGMVVFDDSDKRVYYYDGTAWVGIGGGSGSGQGIQISGNTVSLTSNPSQSSFGLATTAPSTNGQLLVWNGTGWTSTTFTNAPTNGQVLTWNSANNRWEPQALGANITLSGDITGPVNATTIPTSAGDRILAALNNGATTSKLLPAQITAGANGQVLTTVGGATTWSNATGSGVASVNVTSPLTNSGTASTPNIGFAGWPGNAAGVLTNNGLGTLSWTAPTTVGPASGDLSGTYPNPTVSRINGTSLALLPTGILKNTTGTGVPTIATGADLPVMTSTVGGAVPTPPNNTTTFLRGDGTFATPAGGGTVTNVSVATANGFNGSVATATSTPTITLGTTLSGMLKGNGSALQVATAGTDYQAPLTLSTSGTSGAATLVGNTLNIPNYSGTIYAAGTGLTLSSNTFSVNTSQNISTLSNLTSNGLIRTTGGTGALSIATAGTDYLAPNGNGAGLTNLDAGNISSGTLVNARLNVGTAPNQIVQLDGTGRLPAVDGSQLTNLAGGGDITGVTAGTGLAGGATSGNATLNVDVGTTSNKIVQLDGSGRLPAVDGSQLTNLPAGTETDPVVRGINGLVKSNGTTIGAVVSGTDIKTVGGTSILGSGNIAVVTAETDPAVRAVNGLVKSDGTTIGNAVAGSDYLTPTGNGQLLTNLDADNIATGTLANARLNVGTAPNQIVQLDGSGRLPAVDGSQLTNLPGGGSVSTVTVNSANGFNGTVTNPTSTPAITLGTSLIGVLKGNGTALQVATAGTDYQLPLTLTTTGTGGAATLTGNTLNVPNYTTTPYSAGAGLTLSSNTFSVNPSQNISTLSNLTTNGLIRTTGGTGALSIATAGTDYLTPTGNGSGLTNLNAGNISSGTLAIANGGTNSTATPTNGGVTYGTGTAYAFTTAGTSGQFLQSNGAAAPTWVNAPATTTASNGLTKTGNDIALGGTLAGSTTIANGGFNLGITGTGNVGIGTTTPVEPLSVMGQIGWGGLAGGSPNRLQSDQGGSMELGGNNFTANPLASGSPYIDFHYGSGIVEDFNFRIVNSFNRVLDFVDNTNASVLRITNGNVGIGNTSPVSKLDVSGDLRLAPITAPAPTTDKLYNVGGNLFWNGTNISSGGSGWGLTGNAGTNPATNFIGTTDAQPLRLATGAGGIERMRIDATGNIGIGTATPTSKLQVAGGNIELDDAKFVGLNPTLDFVPYDGKNLATYGLGWTADSWNVNGGTGWLSGYSGLKFFTNGQFVRMVIDQVGNVGLGTTSPGSKLDVEGDLRLAPITAPSTPTNKLYNVGGSLFWNGTNISSGGSGWALGGNNGTVDGAPGTGTNYVGTRDNVPLNFMVNSQRAGRIDENLLSTFIGVASGRNNTGLNNTAIGYFALPENTGGVSNTAVGTSSLNRITTGNQNTAVGVGSLFFNQTGADNAAFGFEALSNSTSGSRNTGIGFQSLNVTTGQNNTAVGASSGFANTSGNNNSFFGAGADATIGNLTKATAIGFNAKVATSNSLVLGGTGVDAVNVGIGNTGPTEALDVTGNLKFSGALMPNNTTGTSGQVLTSNGPGSAPTWGAAGLTNPLTTTGDIIYGVGTTPTRLAGAAGFLKSTGAAAPAWSAVNLASADVTGIVPIANGGTNSSATATNGGVGYGTGTAHAYTTAGTSGQLLQSNGAAAPTWVNPVREVADEFTAVASQTSFTLTQTPAANSKVKFYINGIRISNTAYSVVGTTLTYNATNNGTYVLSAGDRVQCDYFY